MTSVRSRLAGLVAVALAAAAGLVGVSSGPAAAALCSGSGVNVVVEFRSLGGGVQKGCAPNGAGKSGSEVFPAAGFRLDYVTNSGFVCRVESLPGGNVCSSTPPANRYWGLFWSNGKSDGWHYSSSGVGGTSVPNGGFIAFVWQSGGKTFPKTAPVNSKPASTPKPQPTKATNAPSKKKATNQSGSGSTSGSSAEEATPDQPSKTQAAAGTSPQKKKAKAAKAKAAKKAKQAKAKAKAKASAKASASSSASADPSDEASPDANSAEKVNSTFTPEEDQGGLPVWVPIGVIAVLAGAAGGTAWWRRRAGAP